MYDGDKATDREHADSTDRVSEVEGRRDDPEHQPAPREPESTDDLRRSWANSRDLARKARRRISLATPHTKLPATARAGQADRVRTIRRRGLESLTASGTAPSGRSGGIGHRERSPLTPKIRQLSFGGLTT